MAFSQSEQVSTPVVDDAGGVRTEAQTAVGDDSATPPLDAPEGWAEALAEQNKPKTVATPVTATTTNSDSSGNGGTAALITGALGICGALLGGNVLGGKNKENTENLVNAMDEYNDNEGFVRQEDFEPDASFGSTVVGNFPGSCKQKFFDANGNPGGWGREVLAEVRAQPKAYVKNVPSDIHQLCPNYRMFNDSTREKYWVWLFVSLASPESSCNPAAANPNAPNGTAKGLYQLEKPFCDRVGVSGSLYQPHPNIKCAVRNLAREIECRGSIMSNTSKGPCGTYWGPLRTDDKNKGRGGDIGAAKKFRALAAKFPGCGPQ